MKARLKIFSYVGLILFLSGFILFNLLLFMEGHKLTKEIIRDKVEPRYSSLLLSRGAHLLDQEYKSNIRFLADLNEVIETINRDKLVEYEISGEEIDAITGLFNNDLVFKFENLPAVFNEESERGAYIIKALRDYGGWLEGKKFSSGEEMKLEVKKIAGNIKKYDIINQKGINRYEAKNLRYRLAKDSSRGLVSDYPAVLFILVVGFTFSGGLLYIFPVYSTQQGDIKNNGIFLNASTNRGWLGILTGSYLILFYILLYYFHEYMTPWIIMADPLSFFLKNSEAGQFFLYGFLYTLVILVMGVRMILKYRHSKYQIFRTLSVMFFQTAFAFLIPEVLIRLNKPYFDFKNIWPLDYDFFFDYELNNLINSGSLGVFMLVWGIILIVIIVPVFVYFFGKRWYCSWVCGCGGLAETLGDPYRQLSVKTLKAWKVERYFIHGVLAFAVIMTVAVLYTYFTGSSTIMGLNSYVIRETYGVWIGAAFAGVVGTGFYPLMGNRVWCRFGCPLAAYLGLIQRFKSRFRITTNGGQCISCGNCSTYCEMGIDVRWYAQRGQDIVRSSCVGCGVCSAVCPRGVLNLENRELPANL